MQRRNIIMLLSAVSFFSCTSLNEIPEAPVFIKGTVTDENETPIEHIQVTLEWHDAGMTQTVFTSSEGTFNTEAFLSDDGQTELTVTLEDIDGEEYGGTFGKSVSEITLLEEEISIALEMAFHLNHATL